ncbi:MAG: hypothetical protein OXH68_00520 [Gammaproteobacteria bacterium]|nr:hypothetical protein [Gammaproteobacteria bacterium]
MRRRTANAFLQRELAAVLIWRFVLSLVDLLGDGWFAVSVLAGISGLVYGGIAVAAWSGYLAITRWAASHASVTAAAGPRPDAAFDERRRVTRSRH